MKVGKVTFDLHKLEILNACGSVSLKEMERLPDRWRQNATNLLEGRSCLVSMYEEMVRVRAFDYRALKLQETGQLYTYPSSLGQEAISVAIGRTMMPDDVFFSQYREGGVLMMRGVPVSFLYLFWGGDERGSAEIARHGNFPFCIPIASHALHAAGVAFAFLYRNESRATVCALGDGATSEGDFYEAMNFAGVFKLPVVFVVSNNQWAISVPRSRQTAAQTFAQKAIAAGILGIRVDGNDIIATRLALEDSLLRARRGNGPTVIEAETYRLGDHTTADVGSTGRYRAKKDVDEAWEREPVKRLRSYLESRGWWSDEEEEGLLVRIKKEVEIEKKEYLRIASDEPRLPEACFDYLYEELPRALLEQRERFLRDARESEVSHE